MFGILGHSIDHVRYTGSQTTVLIMFGILGHSTAHVRYGLVLKLVIESAPIIHTHYRLWDYRQHNKMQLQLLKLPSCCTLNIYNHH